MTRDSKPYAGVREKGRDVKRRDEGDEVPPRHLNQRRESVEGYQAQQRAPSHPHHGFTRVSSGGDEARERKLFTSSLVVAVTAVVPRTDRPVVVDERRVVRVRIVSVGRCAPGGVADIAAAEPLEHERGGVPSAVLAGHEADASLDRAVAGEQLRVSAAAAVRRRRRRRRRRPNGVEGGSRARAGASRGFPPAPALQGRVSTWGAARPFQGRTPARERGERAPDRAPSRGRVAALAVRRHARRVEEWARADGEMTGREARSASEKATTWVRRRC